MAEIEVYALSGIDYTAGPQTGYVLVKDADAILVDASADVKEVCEVLRHTHSVLRAILLTHCHFDHAANVERLTRAFPDAPLYASPLTDAMLVSGDWTAGLVDYPPPTWRVDVPVEEGSYAIGAFSVRVIATPGHTMDSVCYLVDDAYLAAGDTVMNDVVCGNSSLPTGDTAALYRSGQRLWQEVPDSVYILGGHVFRLSDDWELYRPRSTVARAKHRNMINRLL